MKRNEPNSQIRSVLWLITEKIHKIRGTTPNEELLDTLEPQEEPKKNKKKTKNDFLRHPHG